MRRNALFVLGVLLISSFGTMMFVDEVESLEDGVSFMTMYAKDDLLLTPKAVDKKTMDFNRTDRWSQLPMLPWQWYELGVWDSDWIDTRYTNSDQIVIQGVSKIWITLSCPEQITMDLYGSFNVNSNPAVDSKIIENVDIGPEPATFTLEFDTDGYTHENFHHFSMRWSMRRGHDDIVIHLGEDSAGLSTYVEPLYVQGVMDMKEHGLSVEFINVFIEHEWGIDYENRTSWDFKFQVSLDGGPYQEVDDHYFMQGGTDYHYIAVLGFDSTPGEHYFEWEADYGVNSHSSGIHWFTIEEEEPPDDDDDPPPPQPDYDDDYPPIPPDDDDDDDEMWTFEECERLYQDASDDELTFWSTIDSSFRTDSGIEIDQKPEVDIRNVEVYRENFDLVIEIDVGARPELGITDTGITNVYIYFLDPSSNHRQPAMDLGIGSNIETEDYEPSSAIVSTSLFHSSSYWIADQDVQGSNIFVRGTISSLISDGVQSDFEVFVKVVYTDMEGLSSEDSLDFRMTQDYAGYGAWKVDSSLLTESGTSTGTGEGGSLFQYVAAVLISGIVIAVIAAFLVSAARRRKRNPQYPDYYYRG